MRCSCRRFLLNFIFNTVNSIRIMAVKEGQDRAGGNKNTAKALEALGDILHAVYSNRNGMTTVGAGDGTSEVICRYHADEVWKFVSVL